MKKMGRPPKSEVELTHPVSVRLNPTTRYLMKKYGYDAKYLRGIIESVILTRAEMDQSIIDPDDFALIAGARTAQVTGIPAQPKEKTDDETR